MSYNILIADDSRTVQRMMTKTLEAAGLPMGEVHVAGNGLEALDVLRDHWIDLVLTDINMPEMDGIELVERMAADSMLGSVPVVVVSTEGSEERISRLRQCGISGYLRKPTTPESIRTAVEEALGGGDGSH